MRNVSAIVLAAGASARLGEPKQFLPWQGESLIRRVVSAASEAGCARVVVVVAEGTERMAGELQETPAELIANPDWQRGLGTSIHAGVRSLLDAPESPEAVVLLACDQPFVTAQLLRALNARWEISGKAIVASRYANTLGIPALFDRSCFAALLALRDDSGAKTLIQSRRSDVAEIEFEAGSLDIDTPADYKRAKAWLA